MLKDQNYISNDLQTEHSTEPLYTREMQGCAPLKSVSLATSMRLSFFPRVSQVMSLVQYGPSSSIGHRFYVFYTSYIGTFSCCERYRACNHDGEVTLATTEFCPRYGTLRPNLQIRPVLGLVSLVQQGCPGKWLKFRDFSQQEDFKCVNKHAKPRAVMKS